MSSLNRTPSGGLLRHLNLHRVSLPLVALVGAVGIFAPDVLSGAADALTESVFGALDWFFMASVTALLVLAAWLALGPHGNIRLGKEDDRPEFSTASWLAMLFAAGMGVGLLFWGVAEPMIHFSSPPVGDGGTARAARQAMVITNFHWGFHAWAIYGLAAMVLAGPARSVNPRAGGGGPATALTTVGKHLDRQQVEALAKATRVAEAPDPVLPSAWRVSPSPAADQPHPGSSQAVLDTSLNLAAVSFVVWLLFLLRRERE